MNTHWETMDSEFLKMQEEACKNHNTAYEFAKNMPGADITLCQESACKDPASAYVFARDVEGADISVCQESACKGPYSAYKFAKDIAGADIKVCQEAACKDPTYAYVFAKDIADADIKVCQESACKGPYSAYLFAKNIAGADISVCQEAACKDPVSAYLFAKDVEGADISVCQESACKDPGSAYVFAKDVTGADIAICQEAVKETEYEKKLQDHLDEKKKENYTKNRKTMKMTAIKSVLTNAGIKALRHRVMKGCKVAARKISEKYDIKLDLDSEFIESTMGIVVGSAFWGISMIPVDKLKEFPLFEGVNSSSFSVLDNSQSLIKGLGEELLSEGVAVGGNGIMNMAWEAVSPIFGPIIETAEKVRVKEEPVRITLPEEEVEDTEEFEETVEESKTKES